MEWWDLPEWVTESLRGKVLSGISELVTEEVRREVIRGIVERALPRWLRFMRAVSRFASEIATRLGCGRSAVPFSTPCYGAFVYPFIYYIAGYVNTPVLAVSTILVGGRRIYEMVEAYLSNPRAVEPGVRGVLEAFIGPEERWFVAWKFGYCSLMLTAFRRIMDIVATRAELSEVNYLRGVLADCLAEATSRRGGFISRRCLTESGIAFLVSALITELINHCYLTSEVIDVIERTRQRAIQVLPTTRRVPTEFSESVGYHLRIRLLGPGRK